MPEIKRYKQYEILRRSDGTEWKLGSGAMGTTYKAFDTNLERTVALKIINDAYLGSDVARQQFLREARSAAGLRHPNIASVYDLGTDQDHYFYVMELIDGITVKEKVERDGPFSSRDALGLTLQIASALAAAERQRLVHRDLKPANLMLTEEEGEQVVKIIDFGLAKKILPADEVSGAFTIAGGFVGTAEYASPEQIREGDLDARSDIYSLGATLFFLLAGRPPFVGAVGEVMSHHLYKALPLEPLSNQPSVAVELVQRMMEKEREKRPANASELRQLVESALSQLSVPARGERYRLMEPKDETPQGQWFHALDERTGQAVEAFVFNRDLLSNTAFMATLKTQVELARNAPHPLLRPIYSLEETVERTFLIEDVELRLRLQELLRVRQQLTPAEVATLLTRLAPLADHAQELGLQLVDLTLRGIRLNPFAGEEEIPWTERSLDSWKPLELKVDGIDLSLIASSSEDSTGAATWQGGVTLLSPANASGPRSSYLRLLSLLGYELMGGQRSQVEITGRMSPLPAITEEANVVLRKGAVDEFGSATEMANAFKRALAAAAGRRPKTHDVFISYSSNDKTVADAACAILEQHEIRCWVAPRNVAPGADWGESIVEAITASTVMLLIFSSHANRSQQIKREVECAFGADVTVVPFRIERIDPTGSFRFFLGNIHWLDALSAPLETHLQQAADHINAILGRSTVREQTPIASASSGNVAPPARPVTTGPSTIPPPVRPPPLPAAHSVTTGPSSSKGKMGAIPVRPVIQPAKQTRKSVWQRPILLISTALFLALCLGALVCYFTVQQLLNIGKRDGGQDQVVQKEEKQNQIEEKQPVSSARTLTVPGQYSNIQSAIDAAKAGDTVLVKAGVYNEKLKFKEGIILKGQSPDTTIVRYAASPTALVGQSNYDAPLEIRDCKSGQIEQLAFEQTAGDSRPFTTNIFKVDAIIVLNSAIVIKNCRATSAADSGIGVYGTGSAPTLIENQCRSNLNQGIAFLNGAQGRAENDVCEQNQQDGILVSGSGSVPTLRNNTCRSNKLHGIEFSGGSRGSAENNVCEQNQQDGILVVNPGTAPTLKDNACQSNKLNGIEFSSGSLGRAEQNVCTQNGDTGIAVFGSGTAPELFNNQCRLNGYNGIYFGKGAAGKAEQNRCEQNNRYGIAIYDQGSAPEVASNQCRSNKFHGIYIVNGALGRVIENICEQNDDSGIAIRSAAPFLSGNTLRGNAHFGLAYDTSSRPTFGVRNQISGNKLGEVINNAVFK